MGSIELSPEVLVCGQVDQDEGSPTGPREGCDIPWMTVGSIRWVSSIGKLKIVGSEELVIGTEGGTGTPGRTCTIANHMMLNLM